MLLVAKRLNHRPPDCFSKMPRLQELLSKKVLASERTPGKRLRFVAGLALRRLGWTFPVDEIDCDVSLV